MTCTDIHRTLVKEYAMSGTALKPRKRKASQAKAYRFDAERATPILSARETEAFVNAVLNPTEPGPVLRAAARHYMHHMAAGESLPVGRA